MLKFTSADGGQSDTNFGLDLNVASQLYSNSHPAVLEMGLESIGDLFADAR